MLLFGVMTLWRRSWWPSPWPHRTPPSWWSRTTSYAIYLQAVIGLSHRRTGPQAVSRDLRFKSVPLYFSRPIQRADYVLAKLAATAPAHLIRTGCSPRVLHVGSPPAKFDFVRDETKRFSQEPMSVALISLLYTGLGQVMNAMTPCSSSGVAAKNAALTIADGAVSTNQAIARETGAPGTAQWLWFSRRSR
ncbi:Membrane protein OS=Streptomyces microflavus OX=1919 GN=Smic_40100 PE=4 SV=1 [Streptomyces microflavus]